MMRCITSPPGRRRLAALGGLWLLLAAAGCGKGLHPVRGKVAFEDGTPLAGGQVVCEMKEGERTVMARGEVQDDGTFRLGTFKPGDGARPGKYQVLIMPDETYVNDPARHIRAVRKKKGPDLDGRFQSFTTSGLELEVKPGPNEVTFKVARAAQRER
jgi:hypothetical protein